MQIIKPTDIVLCLGAHPDDIAIGCGGMLLTLSPENLTWVCLTRTAERWHEEERAAQAFGSIDATFKDFRDAYLQYDPAVKDYFESLKYIKPTVIFCPRLDDAHQDHRTVAELTYQTFRHSTVFEYEIPKYDGDMGRPNIYISISCMTMGAKTKHIYDIYRSQQGQNWFCPTTWLGQARLRGVESNMLYAEAFTCRKLICD